MAIRLNANARVPVSLEVTTAGVPVTNTPFGTQTHTMKELLIAAFEAIPTQSTGTATVAQIVTALKTLP